VKKEELVEIEKSGKEPEFLEKSSTILSEDTSGGLEQ
jgi:hypothetical protein